VRIGICLKTLDGHIQHVWSLAISLGGSSIVSGSCDFTFKVWDFDTGKRIKTLRKYTAEIFPIAISID